MERTIRAARWSVATIFGINGAIMGSWAVHVPTVQAQLGLSEAVLGYTLLGMAVGSFGIMSFVGGIIARWGSRLVTRLTLFVTCWLIVGFLLMPNAWALAFLMMVFGMFNGTLDVAMNAQAVAVEQHYGRPILSSFHAWFSLGGLIGSGIGSGLLQLGLTPLQHMALFGVVALSLGLWRGRSLLQTERQPTSGPLFAVPRGVLLLLGLLAFCDLVAEGAMIDWSAVYMQRWLNTSPTVAGLAFAAFSATMTVARLVGDRLLLAWGRVPLLRWSAWLGFFGLTVGLLLNHPVAMILGCACVGFGLANVVPVLFGAASSVPGVSSGTGIAAVTTVGYAGFFIGPPSIGFVAEHWSLPWAMGVVAACIAVVAVFGPTLLEEQPTSVEAISKG